MTAFSRKHWWYISLGFLIVLNGFLLFSLLREGERLSVPYPEIQELEDRQFSFQGLSDYFKALAERKGASYAFEVLRVAPIPPNTDLHLLGHVVGDVLYKQQGVGGIKICTEDFRNACSHSIVVGLLLDKGESVLPEIAFACRQAPGGSGAYTMCYHGLGHGILAYTSYDLPRAIQLCQKTGQQEGIQCIGGTIMEIISGGGHDKVLWFEQRKKYVMAENPFYPCSAEFMPDEAKNMCYTYLTPYLWEAVGANIGRPGPEDFTKSFALCNQIPEKDAAYKNTCFGGFGKEFVVLAQDRDVRKIEEMNDEQLLKVYQWCQLAKDKDGTLACTDQALSSLYWGGENDRSVAIRFCDNMDDLPDQNSCFQNLIDAVSYYVGDQNYRREFCNELRDPYRKECQTKLELK